MTSKYWVVALLSVSHIPVGGIILASQSLLEDCTAFNSDQGKGEICVSHSQPDISKYYLTK